MERPASLRSIILAASLGTLFEWYDFYLYGSLAVFFGGLFFPKGNETAQLLASLATFGAGFGVRPLGALVFGHVGDLVGRKYAFLVTMVTMGVGTAFIGILPSYASAGLVATVALVLLRLVQGLALGGEYGGAATYVAEHVPDEHRGYYTSFIQTTATLGFFLSMGVIGTTRIVLGEDAFRTWGWRIPFLLSFVLLGVSIYIRIRMKESPLFVRMKADGKASKHPLKESFTNKTNLRYVLLALFGATAGQGVVWYTGQFYALTFLQATLKVNWKSAYVIVSIALALTTPLFVYFGRLSDRIGRKRIMLAVVGPCRHRNTRERFDHVAPAHRGNVVLDVAIALAERRASLRARGLRRRRREACRGPADGTFVLAAKLSLRAAARAATGSSRAAASAVRRALRERLARAVAIRRGARALLGALPAVERIIVEVHALVVATRASRRARRRAARSTAAVASCAAVGAAIRIRHRRAARHGQAADENQKGSHHFLPVHCARSAWLSFSSLSMRAFCSCIIS
jgi:MFS family permease